MSNNSENGCVDLLFAIIAPVALIAFLFLFLGFLSGLWHWIINALLVRIVDFPVLSFYQCFILGVCSMIFSGIVELFSKSNKS